LLQLSWIGLFGTKFAFLHLENPNFQEPFLSKTNSMLTGNNVLDAETYNIDGFHCRDTYVF
jgi:hypothetical protein